MIDYLSAIEEMKRYSALCWNSSTFSILETKCELRQYGVEEREAPKLDKFYGRLQISTLVQERVNFGELNSDKKRYRTHGLLTLTAYGPKSEPTAFDKIRAICNIMRILYTDRTIADITYQNSKVVDSMALDQNFFKMNMTTEFYFDEGI
jgi:hypothetical protein